MSKEVVWTKIILETFLEESGILDRIELGDEKARILEGIMRTRCAGWKISKQAMQFNCDESTINKYILELKKLYDETQKHSLILPKRIKKSKVEEILDEAQINNIIFNIFQQKNLTF